MKAKVFKKIFFQVSIISTVISAPLIFTSCSSFGATEYKDANNKMLKKTKEFNEFKNYYEKVNFEMQLLANTATIYPEEAKNIVIWNDNDWNIEKDKILAIKSSAVDSELDTNINEFIKIVDQTLQNNFLLIVDNKSTKEDPYWAKYKYSSTEIIDNKVQINILDYNKISIELGYEEIKPESGIISSKVSFYKIPKKGLNKKNAQDITFKSIKTWDEFSKYQKRNPL